MSSKNVSIPDEDIENMLHKVVLNGEEYLIGKTGNVYHRDKKFIVGVIESWDGVISKNEEKKVSLTPVLGYEKLKNINEISKNEEKKADLTPVLDEKIKNKKMVPKPGYKKINVRPRKILKNLNN